MTDPNRTSVGDVPAPKFKCCSPRCPGYSFKASEMAHPAETCGLPPALQQDIRNIIAATVSDGVAIGARDERAAVVKYLRGFLGTKVTVEQLIHDFKRGVHVP